MLMVSVKSSLLFPADTSELFLLSPGSPHHEGIYVTAKFLYRCAHSVFLKNNNAGCIKGSSANTASHVYCAWQMMIKACPHANRYSQVYASHLLSRLVCCVFFVVSWSKLMECIDNTYSDCENWCPSLSNGHDIYSDLLLYRKANFICICILPLVSTHTRSPFYCSDLLEFILIVMVRVNVNCRDLLLLTFPSWFLQ